MNYVYVTKNTQSDKDTMNGYVGTKLVDTEPDFLVWLWTNPQAPDLQATQGVNPSVNVIAMAIINIIKE